jgi:hypothetical protein
VPGPESELYLVGFLAGPAEIYLDEFGKTRLRWLVFSIAWIIAVGVHAYTLSFPPPPDMSSN